MDTCTCTCTYMYILRYMYNVHVVFQLMSRRISVTWLGMYVRWLRCWSGAASSTSEFSTSPTTPAELASESRHVSLSHLHIFTFPHLHISTSTYPHTSTSSHLHTFTSSHFHISISSYPHFLYASFISSSSTYLIPCLNFSLFCSTFTIHVVTCTCTCNLSPSLPPSPSSPSLPPSLSLPLSLRTGRVSMVRMWAHNYDSFVVLPLP